MVKKLIIINILSLCVTLSALGMLTSKIKSNDILDLNTVIDYEVTDTGLLLYTNDGSSYYLE